MTYQNRDWEVIDYALYKLEGTERALRGPRPPMPLVAEGYFVCLGAAQTFGPFCERPFPALLSERLGLPALNLGFAGAGPRYFLKHEALFRIINQARFAVVQVMSGRSVDNSLFQSDGQELLTRRADGTRLGAEPAYRELLAGSPIETVKRIVAETRGNWSKDYQALLHAIEIPTIQFWFSRRRPRYRESYSDVHALFGEFPHLVTAKMNKGLKRYTSRYVECVTERGLPQPLISRFTGQPTTVMDRADLGGQAWTHNSYYPSPEMHMDAATALEPVSRAWT